MIVGYRGNAPTEDGYYLVRVHNPSQTWDTIFQVWMPDPDVGELVIAEAIVSGLPDGITWNQIGIDYDVWTHESIARYELDVICRLDLEAIENGARSQDTISDVFQQELDAAKAAFAVHSSNNYLGRSWYDLTAKEQTNWRKYRKLQL